MNLTIIELTGLCELLLAMLLLRRRDENASVFPLHDNPGDDSPDKRGEVSKDASRTKSLSAATVSTPAKPPPATTNASNDCRARKAPRRAFRG